MASDRPLLIPSPRTPSPLSTPMPVPPALPPSGSRRSASQRSNMSDRVTFATAAELRSSSRSRSATVPAETLPRSASKPPAAVRYGSRRSDSRGASYREISDDEARFVYVGDPERSNQPVRLPNNGISTAKYNVLTFLPRNLFEQFHRLAYIYFLVLAGMNQIPQLAVFGRETSVLPLAFVLGVTAVKDGYEDWRRHRADRAENSRVASVLVGGEFQPKPWQDIRVGEVVKVHANETIPCDVVLLSTSDPTGVAYIQTVNLDGESNLKTRYAKQETLRRTGSGTGAGTGLLVRCERPNRNIYGFHANMEVEPGKRVALGPSNVALRGCEVKNTSWAVGVAVYTGMETKVMLNSSGAPSKRSRLESHMNRETVLLALFLFVQCTVVTVLGGVWLGVHRDELGDLQYYRKRDYSGRTVGKYSYYGMGWEVFFTFLRSVIVFQVMIPISLYVSMELVRLGQAFFMIQDKRLYDEATKTRFQCRALNINEDLGQIKYVFSDKTGTLTENKMEFRCASVHGTDYSGGGGGGEEQGQDGGLVLEDDQVLRPKMSVRTDPKLQQLLRSRIGTAEGERVRDFFLALATCNTVVPLVVETENPTIKLIDYQGESPDEQALVYAAAAYGFVLVERTSGHIVIDVLGERQRYVSC